MPDSAKKRNVLPLDADQLAFWVDQLKESRRMRQGRLEKWREFVHSYEGKVLTGESDQDRVVVPKDFANVETKKAQLFFQLPDVQLKAEQPGLEQAVQVFQQVLNSKLNGEVDALTLIDQVLTDVLICAIGPSKIGYEAVTDGVVQVESGQVEPVMDPTGMPMMDPTSGEPAMRPIMVPMPNVIAERYFWERISPAQFLVAPDFKGDDYDKASWLGFEFTLPLEVAKRVYDLPKEFDRHATEEETLQDVPDVGTEHRLTKKARLAEIWYRAADIDPAVKHPEAFRVLTFVEGEEQPVRHEDSDHHRFEQGKLAPNSLKGNPIHVLTLRSMPDSPYPRSEVEMGQPQTKELNKGRTQMIQQRDGNVPIRGVDGTRVHKDILEKIAKGIVQSIIVFDGPVTDDMMKGMDQARFPPENFTFNDVAARDLDELWALGPNQRGLQSDTVRSATETQIVQAGAETRLSKEQGRVLRWYIKGVQKLGALIQQYADEPDYVEMVGADGSVALQQWDKTTIAGRFAYSAKPDSAVRINAAFDRKQALDLYQMTANDPFVNRQELLVSLFRKHNLDPTKVVVQPPPKGPEPPNISFRFSGEDFVGPQAPVVFELLRQTGIQITPEAMQATETLAAIASAELQTEQLQQEQAPANGNGRAGVPQHGGAAAKMEPLGKHQADQTMGRQGMAGGGMMGMGQQG